MDVFAPGSVIRNRSRLWRVDAQDGNILIATSIDGGEPDPTRFYLPLEDIQLPSYDHQISALFFLLSLILFADLGLAARFFGDPFLFWHHAFSDLGDTITRQGHSNWASRMIFSIGMIIESCIMLKISYRYVENRDFRNRTIKRWLAVLGAIGFLVSMYPNNINHFFHSLGAGTAIGALYLFTMIFHFELKPLIPSTLFYTDVVILQMAVFSYAVTFFADAASKQSFQKICMIGLFFALLRSVSIVEESFSPSEMLGFFKRIQH
jgi:hypothetical membrane protein